jgi:rhamnosyltransferase
MIAPDHIVATVVAYHPRSETIENARLIAAQVKRVIVIDNTDPPAPALADLRTLGNVEVIANGRNLGIAAALNAGCARARQFDALWLATFDQDSRPPADFIQRLGRGLAECAAPETVGILAPAYADPSLPRDARPPRPPHEIVSAMTSGNLVNLAALERCGGFRESFFIDYVDHELCLRLRKHGFRVVQVDNAVLQHRLGSSRRHVVGGFAFTATHHNAQRRFFMSRNRVRLYREYAVREARWVLRDMRAFAKDLLKIVLAEQEKSAKLAAAARGTLAGLFSRSL